MAEFTFERPKAPEPDPSDPRVSPIDKVKHFLQHLSGPEINASKEKIALDGFRKMILEFGKQAGNYQLTMPNLRHFRVQPNQFPNPLDLRLPLGDRFTNMNFGMSPLEQLMQNPRLGQFLRQTFPGLQRTNYQMPVYNMNWQSLYEPFGGQLYLPQFPQILPPFSECHGGGGPGGVSFPMPHMGIDGQQVIAKKPVIYLYPTTPTDVTVSVDLPGGSMISEYPVRKDGAWSVHAETDGTLTDTEKKAYGYLFWEGLLAQDIIVNPDNATCVQNTDYAGYLETSLTQLGLNARERNDFIVYWLPVLQKHPHALIRFCGEDYAAQAPLSITPKPDSMIRVFMAFEGMQKHIHAKGQILPHGKRSGFTVIEWGGTEVVGEMKRHAK